MPNALAREKSPYLLQHADNPVQWLPWGEAAFAKAREEQKPIFLSIGYSTCHWCHVMAHESFEDEAIAALLNADFVPVKVDREERPDVDKVYMAYVQAFTGHGGWPLSAWLTPELMPFFGGTYFPPEDRHGRAGFPSLLKAIAKGWRDEREKLVAEGERVLGALRDYHAQRNGAAADGSDLGEAGATAFEKGFQYFYEAFDPDHGGFGGAPKFPRASNLNFLFRCAAVQGVDSDLGREVARMAGATLQHMARGGIHDQVGGGFHRYSVDAGWFVPHFEKMLYDQAQIAVNLLDASRLEDDPRYAWVARGIFDYVLRDLTHPAGGFFSAEDADSRRSHDGPEHAEGAFYVWEHAELGRVLGEDAALIGDHFGVKPDGNVPAELDPQGEFRGRNILHARQSLVATAQEHGVRPEVAAEKLAHALERLRAVRASRPRPHLDDKVITAWNGLMISALARGAVSPADCLADKREFYREAAVRAAEFIRRELYDEARGVLYRAWRDGARGETEAFAEDYAMLAAGLLDLYEATFDARWLQWADRLQATMDRLFGDAEAGGYFTSAAEASDIILRLKEDYDGAEPAAASVAASNLARLAVIFHDDGRRAQARRTVLASQPVWAATPQALPEMLAAMERLLEPPAQVVIAGDPDAADFQALVAEVRRAGPGPHRAVIAATGRPDEDWLAERAGLAGMIPVDGRAAAYVCEDYACQAPVTAPAELRKLLRTRAG